MSGAERARRHRARKAAERAAASGVQGDGAWVEQFPGQREPWKEGNLAAVTHGARSARLVGPRAAEIVGELLRDPECPHHLKSAAWKHALIAWGWAEAEAERVREWRDQQTALEAATEHSETEEDESRTAMGGMSRRTRGRRVMASSDVLDRAERRAAARRADLGLTPASRARLGASALPPTFSLALEWAGEPGAGDAAGGDPGGPGA